MAWPWLVVAIVKMAIVTGISYGLSRLTAQKAKDSHTSPQEMDEPTVEEGSYYTVVFGLGWIENFVLSWWGDKKSTENTARENGTYYTVSHYYYIGAHHLLTQGSNDGIIAMKFGDYHMWPNADDSSEFYTDGVTQIVIDELEAFGGQFLSGGIQGTIDIQYGDSDQTINDYLYALQGSNVSANRGFTGAIWRQLNCGTSPNIPSAKYLLKRTNKLSTSGGTQWYAAKAAINTNRINPAHLLRECFTDMKWGYRKSAALFNDTIWQAVADILYTESFGLAMKWQSNQSLEDFMKDVLRHIDGRLYEDHSTGEIVLKLIRNDYNIEDLETFDENDIESIEDYSRDMPHKVPNVTYLTYTDIINNSDVSIKYSDQALINLQGGMEIANNVEFKGIIDDDLAAKVIIREQNLYSMFPAYMTVRAKRTMAHKMPGDVFKLNYTVSDTVITGMVVRILDVDYGTLDDGYISFECMQDIFSLPAAQYSNPPSSNWYKPDNDAEDVTDYMLSEIPYYSLVKRLNQSVVDVYENDAGFLMAAAASPTSDAIKYDILIRSSLTSDFLSAGSGVFTPNATIDNILTLAAADTTIDLSDVENLGIVQVGQYAVIENEIVKILANDNVSQIEIARGSLDTVPAAHAVNSRIWFIEAAGYFGNSQYTAGDQPGVKFLPLTARNKLDEADATARDATEFNSRMIRPYPAGDFKINSESYPTGFIGQPTLTWAHRNRLTQIYSIELHSAASIPPETGTTYTLKIYDESNVLARTVTGLTVETYEYTEAFELSDKGYLNGQLRFVLMTVRDGYESWQSYDVTIGRSNLMRDENGHAILDESGNNIYLE